MEDVPFFVDKIDLLEDYIQQTTGLQVDRVEFEQNGYMIDVTYYGYNKNSQNYNHYKDQFHIFDIIALIYKKQNYE